MKQESMYQENRLTPIFSKMKNKKVIVVGAGAIGSLICECLTRNGVGHLVVADLDKYEPHNLPKSSFVIRNPDDLGKDKAPVLAKRLKAYAKEGCAIQGHCMNLRELGPYALKNFDYVVAALDNLSIRIFLQELVKQCPAPQPVLLSCGTNAEHAEALIFAPEGACLRCTVPDSWLQSENPETVHSCAQQINYLLPQKAPLIVSTSGIASMKSAVDVDDMITGHVMGDLHLTDSLRYIQDSFPYKSGRLTAIAALKNCPVCKMRPPENITVLEGCTKTITLRQMLANIKAHCDFDFQLRVHMLEIPGAPSQYYNQFVLHDSCQYCGSQVDVFKHSGSIRKSEIICNTCQTRVQHHKFDGGEHALALTAFRFDETNEALLDKTLFDLGYPVGAYYVAEKIIAPTLSAESEMDLDNLFADTAKEKVFVLKDDEKYLFE